MSRINKITSSSGLNKIKLPIKRKVKYNWLNTRISWLHCTLEWLVNSEFKKEKTFFLFVKY